MTAYDTFKAGILGNPFDPKKKPSRQGAVQGFKELYDRAEEISDNITTNQVVAATWSELSGITGTFDNQGGEVLDSDTGTHTDTPTSTTVDNAGRYKWTGAVWQRIGDTGLTGKASEESVAKPSFAGKKNGWPDPFFEEFGVGDEYLGRQRWFPNSANEFTIVENSVFDGNAVRFDTAPGGLTGPFLWLDDLNASFGDVVTVCAVVIGTGVTMAMGVRQTLSETANSSVGASGSGSHVTSSTPTLVKTQITIDDANAVGLRVYPYETSGSGTFDIVAFWAYKGTTGPEWPVFTRNSIVDEDKFSKIDQTVATSFLNFKDVASITDVYEKTSGERTIQLAVSSPLLSTTYGFNFKGWGERLTPAGVSFNALNFKKIGRKADVEPENFWAELHVVVRTGSNPVAENSTLLAVGKSRVPPNKADLSDITVVLKHPTTGNVVTLSDSDFEGGKYMIGYYVKSFGGGVAYCSPARGTMSNSDNQSYYFVGENPETEGWSNFASNQRVGAEHLLITDPESYLDHQQNLDFFENLNFSSQRDTKWGVENLPNLQKMTIKNEAITIGLFGDSWTHTPFRIWEPLYNLVNSSFGVSSVGYVSACADIVRPDIGGNLMVKSQSGTWVNVRSGDPGGYGPEGAHAETTDNTAQLIFDPKGSEVATQWRIHYVSKSGGGTFSYKVAIDGTPVQIDTNTAPAYRTVTFNGNGGQPLYIDIDSAGSGVIICGVEVLNEVAGEFTIHKLGNGGATAERFLNIPTSYFENAVSTMGIDCAFIILGTNENASDLSLDAFRENIQNMADSIKNARPLCDIVLVGPGPNGGDNAQPMRRYNDVLFEIARDNTWAFLDLERYFDNYDDAVARGLYDGGSDLYHPNSDGGLVIGKAIYDAFLKQFT